MLVDCLMQVYRIGFLVTSLPVNCNKALPFTVIAASLFIEMTAAGVLYLSP